jgi:hypothetical protein
LLFPQLTSKVMQLAENRIRQYERVFGKKMTVIQRDIFLEAYKASRMDVFNELDVRKKEKEVTIPEVTEQGFTPAMLRANLNRE